MFLQNNKIIFLFFLFFIYIGINLYNFYNDYKDYIKFENFKHVKLHTKFFKIPRIAHAGGYYNGIAYTNSIDALNFNKENFNFFEIDLYINKDNEIICTHNPEDINIGIEIFLRKYQFTPCTIKTLSKWLADNPDKTIVTDVKSDNIMLLKEIRKFIPNFNERIIPQIYHFNEYQEVKKLGYNKIIWTFYRLDKPKDNFLKFLPKLKSMNLFAVTVPINYLFYGYVGEIKKIGIPVYTHTVNSQKRFLFFKFLFGIDEVYTDHLIKNKI